MEKSNYQRPSLEKKWLVVYTRPRWEKKIEQLLIDQGITAFCPTQKIESQWADRKKIVHLPLFSSYVFVHINYKEDHLVRQTIGVLSFIYYQGKPAIVRDSEIEQIKHYLQTYGDIQVVSLQDVVPGDRVSVKDGAFHNQQGKVVEVQGKSVLMVFDNLQCALVTKVERMNLTVIKD